MRMGRKVSGSHGERQFAGIPARHNVPGLFIGSNHECLFNGIPDIYIVFSDNSSLIDLFIPGFSGFGKNDYHMP